jgi:hypothetical protein
MTTDSSGDIDGYQQVPTVAGILEITNPLLEGVK